MNKESILAVTAQHYNITLGELTQETTRHKEHENILVAKQMAAYIMNENGGLREYGGYSWKYIALTLGWRNRQSAMDAAYLIQELLTVDKATQEAYSEIIKKIKRTVNLIKR